MKYIGAFTISSFIFLVASSFIEVKEVHKLENSDHNYGILGQEAPEFKDFQWIGSETRSL